MSRFSRSEANLAFNGLFFFLLKQSWYAHELIFKHVNFTFIVLFFDDEKQDQMFFLRMWNLNADSLMISSSPAADQVLGGLLTWGQGHLIERTHTQQTVLTTLPIMHLSSWVSLLLFVPRVKKRSEAANQLQVTFLQFNEKQTTKLFQSFFFSFHSSFLSGELVLRSSPVGEIVVSKLSNVLRTWSIHHRNINSVYSQTEKPANETWTQHRIAHVFVFLSPTNKQNLTKSEINAWRWRSIWYLDVWKHIPAKNKQTKDENTKQEVQILKNSCFFFKEYIK